MSKHNLPLVFQLTYISWVSTLSSWHDSAANFNDHAITKLHNNKKHPCLQSCFLVLKTPRVGSEMINPKTCACACKYATRHHTTAKNNYQKPFSNVSPSIYKQRRVLTVLYYSDLPIYLEIQMRAAKLSLEHRHN